MTYSALVRDITTRLSEAGATQPGLEARELCAFAAGLDAHEYPAWRGKTASAEELSHTEELVRERLSGRPLAYILGEWDFYGLTLHVTPDTLIPRADSECMIDHALSLFQGSVRVLDLCCGTGCLGLAFLHERPGAACLFADISPKALSVARKNAERHGLTGRCEFTRADMLKEPPGGIGPFDLILCNPPYIPKREYHALDRSVKDFEPRQALLAGEDGLLFYRAAESWLKSLAEGGKALFEFGAGQEALAPAALASAAGREVSVYPDLTGRARFCIVES